MLTMRDLSGADPGEIEGARDALQCRIRALCPSLRHAGPQLDALRELLALWAGSVSVPYECHELPAEIADQPDRLGCGWSLDPKISDLLGTSRLIEEWLVQRCDEHDIWCPGLAASLLRLVALPSEIHPEVVPLNP